MEQYGDESVHTCCDPSCCGGAVDSAWTEPVAEPTWTEPVATAEPAWTEPIATAEPAWAEPATDVSATWGAGVDDAPAVEAPVEAPVAPQPIAADPSLGVVGGNSFSDDFTIVPAGDPVALPYDGASVGGSWSQTATDFSGPMVVGPDGTQVPASHLDATLDAALRSQTPFTPTYDPITNIAVNDAARALHLQQQAIVDDLARRNREIDMGIDFDNNNSIG